MTDSAIRPVAIGGLQLRNNLTLAPMAGYTHRALRMLARQNGAALAWTEMISAYELIRPNRKTRKMLDIAADDHPLGIQIFGHDEKLMGDAAAAAEARRQFELIDVNLACPVRKVVNNGNGGAMLRRVHTTLRVLESMRRNTTLPLTIKVRRGFDDAPESRAEVADLLLGAEALGINAVTIHGRTVLQIYHGQAEWDFIGEMADRLRMPVFGSGDLMTGQTIVERLSAHPKIAGVAVARGAVGHPWIFREALAIAAGHDPPPVTRQEKIETLWQHYEMLIAELGDYTAIRTMRRFGMFYSKRLARAREARLALGKILTREEFAAVVRDFFETDEPAHP